MPWRKKKEFPHVLVISVIVYVALAMGFLYAKEFSLASLPAPFGDEPPRISLTWSPPGEADLKTMKAHLRITDDHGLDFSTFKLMVGELGRVFNQSIPGVIGKEYETDLSFSWLADEPTLAGAGKMTLYVSITDDQGHKTTVTKVVPLKNWQAHYPKNVQDRLDRAAAAATAPSP